MSGRSKKAYAGIIRSQIVAGGMALIASLGFGLRSHMGEQGIYNIAQESVTQSQNEVEMWSIIDGEKNQTEVNALENFASNISDWIESGQDPADFRGRAGIYKGLAEDVGYPVFQGSDCEDCGQLTDSFASRLTSEDHSVEVVENPHEDPRFLSFGGMLKLVGVWQIAAAGGLFYGLYRYGNDEVLWIKGDGEHDQDERTSFLLAPIGHVVGSRYIKAKGKKLREEEAEFISANGLDEQLVALQEQIYEIKRGPITENNNFIIGELEKSIQMINELPSRVRHVAKKEDPQAFEALELVQNVKDAIEARVEVARQEGA